MADTEQDNHALNNAKGWMQSIVTGMILLDALSSGDAESGEYDGETFDNEDALRERLEQSPLSVQVRVSQWFTPGDEKPDADEYMVLLSTGGPALRIVGDLGDWNEPDSATLEYQDWGTPWTAYDATSSERDHLKAFASLMYYGEG